MNLASVLTEYGHATLRGGRDYQQDAYSVAAADTLELREAFALADGMGAGSRSGPVAETAAVAAARFALASCSLRTACIRAAAKTARAHPGRGEDDNTTLVVARVTEKNVEVAWIGDSRAYARRRGGALHPVTRDHNLAALGLPNILTRTLLAADGMCKDTTGLYTCGLGARCPTHGAETISIPVWDQSRQLTDLVLVTDGAYSLGAVGMEELLKRGPHSAAEAIVAQAVEIGGPDADNATALVLAL